LDLPATLPFASIVATDVGFGDQRKFQTGAG